jgi:hypothetical protein
MGPARSCGGIKSPIQKAAVNCDSGAPCGVGVKPGAMACVHERAQKTWRLFRRAYDLAGVPIRETAYGCQCCADSGSIPVLSFRAKPYFMTWRAPSMPGRTMGPGRSHRRHDDLKTQLWCQCIPGVNHHLTTVTAYRGSPGNGRPVAGSRDREATRLRNGGAGVSWLDGFAMPICEIGTGAHVLLDRVPDPGSQRLGYILGGSERHSECLRNSPFAIRGCGMDAPWRAHCSRPMPQR